MIEISRFQLCATSDLKDADPVVQEHTQNTRVDLLHIVRRFGVSTTQKVTVLAKHELSFRQGILKLGHRQV